MTPKNKYTLNLSGQQSGLQSMYTPPKTSGSALSSMSSQDAAKNYLSGGVSSAWQDWGATKKVAPDGSYLMRNTPSSPSGTNPQSPTTTGSPVGADARASYQSQLADIMKGAQNLQTSFDSYKASQAKPTYPEVPKQQDSEYLKFMKGLQDPQGLKMAYQSQTDLAKMTADEIARTREQQEEIQKNEAGMIERGQTYLRQDLDRESAKTLADLAIAKGYNTDIINQQMAIGASIGEAQEALRREAEAPLSYEEAAALGLPFGTTMAEARQAGVVPQGGGFSASDVDSWAQMVSSGQLDISKVPEEMRTDVINLVNAGGGIKDPSKEGISEYHQERITRELNVIDELMDETNNWTTGVGSLLSWIPGTPATNFQAKVRSVTSNLAFGELTAMRDASKTGGALGQVSNIELGLLESSLGSLDTAQSPEAFKASLNQVKNNLYRWMAVKMDRNALAKYILPNGKTMAETYPDEFKDITGEGGEIKSWDEL